MQRKGCGFYQRKMTSHRYTKDGRYICLMDTYVQNVGNFVSEQTFCVVQLEDASTIYMRFLTYRLKREKKSWNNTLTSDCVWRWERWKEIELGPKKGESAYLKMSDIPSLFPFSFSFLSSFPAFFFFSQLKKISPRGKFFGVCLLNFLFFKHKILSTPRNP